MKKIILIILVKLSTFILKILGKNATVFPGKIAYDADNFILDKIKYPKYVIAVTGSAGKGSTTSVIAHILRNAGLSVSYNQFGSNGIYGVTSLVLQNSTIFGKFKKDVLLVEIDERHIKLAFNKKHLTHLVVTNITRDQPSRSGAPEIIYQEIFDCIDINTTLIINADDPLVNKITTSFKGKIITYGMGKNNSSTKKPLLNNVDNAYCPKCHTKLNYAFYHYGHLGNYSCPNCDFKRGKVDYEATNISLIKQEMKINGIPIYLNKNVLYAVYYELAAYALCDYLKINNNVILESLNKDYIKPKRGNIYNIFNRELNMMESKNENSLSYYQTIKYIMDYKDKKTIILGFDNVSRRYRFNDISWLYDVNFEMLNDDSIDKIVCIGRFRLDVATRLNYAGIDNNKLILVDDLNNLLNIIEKKTKGTIFTMVCFDMSDNILKLLKGEKL